MSNVGRTPRSARVPGRGPEVPPYHVGLFALLLVSAAFAETPAIFRDIDRSMRELSEITGLRAPKRVAYDSITKDHVNQFLKDRVKETVKPEDLRIEELTLKKFGFIPSDFDLAKSTVELLTEQAAAFYDFRKKKLFLTDWASGMRDDALVHELAHALADQNFGLERFMKGPARATTAAWPAWP